jgi:hypothetical protein
MTGDDETGLLAQHTDARAAIFPGSRQVQLLPWSTSAHSGRRNGDERTPYDSYFYVTVDHTDFDPEWPISVDWPTVIRGLRGSFGVGNRRFAELCDVEPATVALWETGRAVPFNGDALRLLTLLRPHVRSPVQAGQALNVAAAVVLPHLTMPTAEYAGRALVAPLRAGGHDHRDLGVNLLDALVTARILVPLGVEHGELGDTYVPFLARGREDVVLPAWAPSLIDDLFSASEADRRLVLDLAHRICRRASGDNAEPPPGEPGGGFSVRHQGLEPRTR